MSTKQKNSKTQYYILVVDDEASVGRSLKMLLSRAGYLVDVSMSGSHALEEMEKKEYDLVLSDMIMDDIDGLELLKEVKAKHPHVPFLLITGYASLGTAVEALRSGVYDYIQKPFDNKELLLRVENALRTLDLWRESERSKKEKDELLKKIKDYSENLERMVEERTETLRRSEQALKASEKQYSTLVENSPDIIFTLDSKGRFSFVGGAAERLLGHKPEELLGKHFSRIMLGDDVKKSRWHFNERRTGDRSTKGFEVNLVTKEGKGKNFNIKYVPVEIHSAGMYDRPVTDSNKRFLGTYGVARDITLRKQAEEALIKTNKELMKEHSQRKLLSKRLIGLIEKDRHQLAMELHDHIGQMLTTLKMQLEAIQAKHKGMDASIKERIRNAEKIAIQAMKDIRIIAYGLSPTMLDSLGLIPSLRSLFDEIKKHADIEIHFFTQKMPKKFDKEYELAIFRVVQEAINNIVKHSQAKNAFINLLKKEKAISLTVEDDGIGFDTQKAMKLKKRKGPLGLTIMRERIVQLDGEFSIDSRIGGGTHLLVEIPL